MISYCYLDQLTMRIPHCWPTLLCQQVGKWKSKSSSSNDCHSTGRNQMDLNTATTHTSDKEPVKPIKDLVMTDRSPAEPAPKAAFPFVIHLTDDSCTPAPPVEEVWPPSRVDLTWCLVCSHLACLNSHVVKLMCPFTSQVSRTTSLSVWITVWIQATLNQQKIFASRQFDGDW